ncbi:MAG: hypothetical protein ACP5UQ_09335, partial [Anaerolineae bacterium]
ELTLLYEQTGARYYYTRTDRPGRCAGLKEVYRGPGHVFIFTANPGPPAFLRTVASRAAI